MKPLNLLMFLLGFFISVSVGLSCSHALICDGVPLQPAEGYSTDSVTNNNGDTVDYVSFSAWGSAYVYKVENGGPVPGGCNWNIPGTGYTCEMREPFSGSQERRWYETVNYVLASTCPIVEPSEPGHCSSGVKDADEVGVDCGGSCSSSCDTSGCFPPYTAVVDSDTGETSCFYDAAPDDYGNCPIGFDSYKAFYGEEFELGEDCIKFQPDLGGGFGQPVSYVASDFPDGLPETEIPTEFTSGSFSTYTEVPVETVVDNGDGSETATSVSTLKRYNSKTGEWEVTGTESTSVNRPSGSSSGTGFSGSGGVGGTGVAPGYSGSSSSSGSTSPEETPENYDYSLGDGDGEFDGSLSEDEIPEEDDISQLFTDFLADSPISTMITGSSIETNSPICELHWTYKGKDVVFSFCDEPWPSTLNFMGQILIFLSTIGTYFIIFGKD